MEEWNAKGRMWTVNLVISNHAPLTANGHPGPIGANVLKPVGMGPKQEQEKNPKLRCMKEKIVKAIPQKLRNVPSNNVLLIANGQPGTIGALVLKPVVMDLKQEQEEKPKLRCMKEKIAKATTQKLRNVTSNNVLSIANGQPGTIGALVPKVVEMELGKEPEKF